MDSSQSAGALAPANTGNAGDNGMLVLQTNDASATAADDSKQNLNQVINSLQKILSLLHQLYLTVSSFNAASQLPLLQRLNALVLELDNMVSLSEKCNIQVPMEVLNLIDDGKNPDEFTKDVINSCIAKNQITKGKTDTFKSLRKHLLEELEQTFPNEVEYYREIRAASAAVFFLLLRILTPMTEKVLSCLACKSCWNTQLDTRDSFVELSNFDYIK